MTQAKNITNRVTAILILASCYLPAKSIYNICKEAIQNNFVQDQAITNLFGALPLWLVIMIIILIIYIAVTMFLDTYEKTNK